MPRRKLLVTPKINTDTLPSWANEYVVLASELEARGVLGEVAKRLQIARRGGFCGLDIFLFLLCYFSSGLRIGLRGFSRECARYARQLAAVGSRRLWPSQASISRFLSDPSEQQIEEFGNWLLNEAVGGRALETFRGIGCRDTRGALWHVFDYDPTVTTLRHRALPEGEDLPEPERRSADMAKAGYSGRKREDVQFSRATLQHGGSGLWLGLSMHPGNGDHRGDNERAIRSVRLWCERTGESLERALLRMDGGAGGSVPAMTACLDEGVHFVTRLWRYELLEHEQVKQRLQNTSWLDVEDALSGPKREAIDIGTMSLSPADQVRRNNGEPYSSIEIRLIVSRTPVTEGGEKRGAGFAKDGWWYELFGTSIPAAAWPAPEIVSLYYGRTGQENRFCQEDRELGLDRIFSYHLPGQHLANLVGLFVWNLRVARGADLVAPLPEKLSAQVPRKHVESSVSTPIPETSLPMPKSATVCCTESNSSPESSKNLDPSAMDPTTIVLEAPAASPPAALLAPTAIVMNVVESLQPEFLDIDATSAVLAALSAGQWNEQLNRLPGWRFDDEVGLVCPNDTTLHVRCIERGKDGSLVIRWRAKASACRNCSRRQQCTTSQAPAFRKELWFSFSSATATPNLAGIAKPAPAATPWRPTPAEDNPGELGVSWPILVPAELRRHFRTVCGEASVDITVKDGKQHPRNPFYIVSTAGERQRRRKTWTWRRERNQLPGDAVVNIVLHGEKRLSELLGAPFERARSAA